MKREHVSSVAWYVGIPGSGKTTLAATHAAELVRVCGYPVLCIDSAGVDQLDHVPRARTLPALFDLVWRQRQHASFIPVDIEDVNTIAQHTLDHGRVILLVDEAAYWISSRKGTSSPLLRLMRAHRHARAHVLLTTQHFSADVPQEALSCAPRLYVFRNTSKAALERFEGEYGLDRDVVTALPRGSCVVIENGFSS